MYYININEILTKNVHNLRFVTLTMHSIQVIVQLMQNLYLMNTSLSEHFFGRSRWCSLYRGFTVFIIKFQTK